MQFSQFKNNLESSLEGFVDRPVPTHERAGGEQDEPQDGQPKAGPI